MSIFNQADYRKILRDHVASRPARGRGEVGRLAAAAGVHPSLMSQILNGRRDLGNEQAFEIGRYLQLTELEADYFATLVAIARAGNHRFRDHLKEKLEHIRTESEKIRRRFTHDTSLSEGDRAIFYSSWLYSAVRLFTSTSTSSSSISNASYASNASARNGRTIEEVAERFQIPRQRVVTILDFLESVGLVTRDETHYSLGAKRTFLPHGSPHLPRHHQNWRNKAIQKSDHVADTELMFTSPVSISSADFKKIREHLSKVLETVSIVVRDSPAEDVACLNIDLFWVNR